MLDLKAFQKHVNSLELFSQKDLVIVGVSGGVDSMVLCHLLLAGGFRFRIAHINYGLRGADSNDDALFVKTWAAKNNVSFDFLEAKMEWAENKSGIQQKARTIRYDWFSELSAQHNATAILTAHHQNDQAETILHNYIRGGGVAALRGMLNVSNGIVRPLLSFSKEEILAYAKANNIAWREDRSNATNDYTRNYIRHEVVPALEKINPNVVSSITHRAAIFRELELMAADVLAAEVEKLCKPSGQGLIIACSALLSNPYKNLVVWSIIEPLGFLGHHAEEVIKLASAESGKQLHSATHIISKDRDQLIVSEITTDLPVYIEVNSVPCVLDLDARISFSWQKTEGLDLKSPSNIAHLAISNEHFPLKLRTWKEGDRFQPLGMEGSQKISDLLVQQKIPQVLKSKILVLECDGEIAWVVGLRISEKFKVLKTTTEALRVVAS
jgi:tRNA(Ile)-lysidine synthase